MEFIEKNFLQSNCKFKRKALFTSAFVFMFFLSGMFSYSQTGDWVDFQTIYTGEETVFDIAYEKNVLAVNYDNNVVVIYKIVNEEFTEDVAYRIRNVWKEFGTLRFYNKDLYVAIDGFKIYRIKLLKKKIKKTNTYKAGFYITERYYKEFKSLKWDFKISEEGDLKIFRNITVSDNIQL